MWWTTTSFCCVNARSSSGSKAVLQNPAACCCNTGCFNTCSHPPVIRKEQATIDRSEGASYATAAVLISGAATTIHEKVNAAETFGQKMSRVWTIVTKFNRRFCPHLARQDRQMLPSSRRRQGVSLVHPQYGTMAFTRHIPKKTMRSGIWFSLGATGNHRQGVSAQRSLVQAFIPSIKLQYLEVPHCYSYLPTGLFKRTIPNSFSVQCPRRF